MSKIYKIHPGIGIGRIGNSTTDFFIGPESPDKPPQEIRNGTETPIKRFKDANGRIKRQGIRFRIYEYEKHANGGLELIREITNQDAAITWTVELANSKAAAPQLRGRPSPQGIPVNSPPRNGSTRVKDLTILPVFAPITGADKHVTANPEGQFLGKEVFLGELITDSDGRLIVLGGRGHSASVPNGMPISNFADNPGWHDDVSDGRVAAQIAFAGQGPIAADFPAWAIFGPPDYAPHVKGITTLYDIAFQAAVIRGWLTPETKPSFRKHVLPILQRASRLRWVNRFFFWDGISRDEKALSDRTDPAGAALRQSVFDTLMSIRPDTILDDFRFTQIQARYLEQWRDNDFIDDFATPQQPTTAITPEHLDRAALDNTVGGGFFPGIEAGIKMTYPEIYEEPFRLTREPYNHLTFGEMLRPGSMSERMACPWQADFKACSGNWWPAQRPDEVIVNIGDGRPNESWDRGADNFSKMVASFGRLGFIVEAEQNGEIILMETERDPTF